jgi:hypothetical protein
MTSAATDLASIGSTLSAAHTAAAAPTTGIVAAAEDEVSTAIAGLFSQHAQQYQALAGQAAAFHNQFTRNLLASANSYLSTEAANALGAATPGGILQSLGNALLSELVKNIPGVEETELILDAAGPVIVTLHGGGGSAFLYGQDTVALPLSLPGASVTLDVPFGGILAPLQPISVTVTGNPPTTFPIPGTQVGGIVPGLIGSLLGGGGLLGG